jgi:hypothetical protein
MVEGVGVGVGGITLFKRAIANAICAGDIRPIPPAVAPAKVSVNRERERERERRRRPLSEIVWTGLLIEFMCFGLCKLEV